MTGAPIDSSLRRPILPTKDKGTEVPDSQAKLAASPQLLMEAGAVRPTYRFDDGDGLTDAFGNKYDGYGGAGGDSFIINHIPSKSVDEEVDTAIDLDFLQYNAAREKYETRSYVESQLAKVAGAVPNDLEILQYIDANGQYEPAVFEDILTALTSVSVEDWIPVFIPAPENKVYILTLNLPVEIDVTAFQFSFGTGSGTVSVPLGTVSSGSDLELTLSALSVGPDAADLAVRIDFERPLVFV